MVFWEKLKPIKVKMEGIRSNVCAQFGQKIVKILSILNREVRLTVGF